MNKISKTNLRSSHHSDSQSDGDSAVRCTHNSPSALAEWSDQASHRQQCKIPAMSNRFSLRSVFSRIVQGNCGFQIVCMVLVISGSCLSVQAQPMQAQPAPGFSAGGFGQGEIIQSPNQQSAAYSIGTMDPDYYSMNRNPNASDVNERGPGWWGRIGYDTGPGLGREESLMFFETMPYIFFEESMFLTDLRLYRLNSGRLGGSAGAGFRKYFPAIDRTFGAIAWIDVDGAYKDTFKAGTISLESRGQNVDFLSNIYLPFDERKQEIGLDFVVDSQNFIGNNVQFDQIRTSGFALQGFDVEVGAPVGLEFAQQFDLRAYAGFYNFNHNELDDIWGWKARLEANLWKYLDLNLGVTDDSTFDTRVTFAASWTLDPNGEAGERGNTWQRMVLPPERLWTIPKAELAVLEADNIVINPVTGLPLEILHVNNNPALNPGVNAAGAGTVTNPFDTIDNAINGAFAPGLDTFDILYVHSGSTYDGEATVIVPEGKRYLGGGDRVEHLITYNDFGTARLPRAIGNYSDHATAPDTIFDARPLYENQGNAGGPGVTFDTLANLGAATVSNDLTEFSGFVLGLQNQATPDTFDPSDPGVPTNGPNGHGIDFVDLPTALTQVRYVDIHDAAANGLNFDTTTDTFLLESIVVNQSFNHEMFVTGGAPNITLKSSIRGETTDLPVPVVVDSIIVNRDNGTGAGPDGAGGLGDNHDLAVTLTTGGSILWEDVVTHDVGGDGIIITGGSQSDVSIPYSTHIENSRGNGIGIFENTDGEITISSGRSSFLVPNRTSTATPPLSLSNPFTIINPTFNAIHIGKANAPLETTTARVNFVEDIHISELNQGNSGVFVANTTGDVIFSSTAGLTIDYTLPAGAGTASGIEFFQNFTGDIVFNNPVDINNAGGAGVRISNSIDPPTAFPTGQDPGTFRTFGDNPFTISGANRNQGIAGASIVIGNDPPAGAPSNNPIAGTSYESLVDFGSPVVVNNRFGMGLWVNGNTGEVRFSDTDNGANFTGGVGGTSVVVLQNNLGPISFTQLRVATGINLIIDYLNDDNPNALELAATQAAVDLRNNIGVINLGEVDLTGVSEGIFGIDNNFIRTTGGDINMTFATGLDIFTTEDRARDFNQRITQIDIDLDDFNNGQSNDYGLHLGNVKGSLSIVSGSIVQVTDIFNDDPDDPNFAFGEGQDVSAGVKLDNHELRRGTTGGLNPGIGREQAIANATVGAEPFFFEEARRLDVRLGDGTAGLAITQNDQGIYANEIDSLRIVASSFTQNTTEAIELINVPEFQVQGSTFTQNQTDAPGFVPVDEHATVRLTTNLALNPENRRRGGLGPTFYDFVVGPRNADFRDPLAGGDQNSFNDPNSDFSIYVRNRTLTTTNPNESRNRFGEFQDRSYTGSETGIIINNNAFVANGNADLDSVVFFEDQLAIGNSEVNMNLAMNEFRLGTGTQADGGVISFDHSSLELDGNDNITFNAIDNQMVLDDQGNIAFRFVDRGTGTAFIGVTDSPDDGLVENNDPLFDNFFLDPTLTPDILITASGAANTGESVFFYDIATDATIEVTNLEIHYQELTLNTNDDQTVFLFDNLSGTTDINISGNTILLDDSRFFPVFNNGVPVPLNNIAVTQFNSVTGDVSIFSAQNNNVGVNNTTFGIIFPLTDPTLLLNGSTINLNGQFQFNGILVP